MNHKRPTRETVLGLLAAQHKPITVFGNHKFVEDVDGAPLSLKTEIWEPDSSIINLTLLGWTQAELDDPNIIE